MNDRLSPNSLILAEKVTRDKVVFIRVLVLVLDGTLRNSSDIIISEPYKNTGTLRMEMFKKLADISLFIRSFSQK